jgi:uncharacterized protein
MVGKEQPERRLLVIGDDERQKIIRGSGLIGHYKKRIDRESAYELLMARSAADRSAETAETTTSDGRRWARQNPVRIGPSELSQGAEVRRV